MIYQRGKGKVIRQENGKVRFKRTWWYRFRFAGRIVHESARTTSKSVARDAERQRRRELEEAINGLKRRTLPPTFEKASQEWLDLKKPTLSPRSVAIEEANLRHLKPFFGTRLLNEISAQDISRYQQQRLRENASPKTVNLEVGTVRAIMRRNRLWANLQPDVKPLRTRDDVGRAISEEEEKRLLAACLESRSRSLYPAVTVALSTGMRYSEIRLLRWKRIDFGRRDLTVGDSKTESGAGRVIPLNDRAYHVLSMWAANFPGGDPEHYVFPFEKYGVAGDKRKPCAWGTDPTKPIGDWKEAWEAAKKRAGAMLKGDRIDKEAPALACRFHDLRHTACTRMLERGVPFSTVATIMGWSPSTAVRMARRYGHTGEAARREAVQALNGANFGGVVHQIGNQISDGRKGVTLTH